MNYLKIPIKYSSIKELIALLKNPEIFKRLNWQQLWLEVEDNLILKCLIKEFYNKTNWDLISQNDRIDWCKEIIDEFQDKLNWSYLSINPSLKAKEQLIKKYSTKLQWKGSIIKSKYDPSCLSSNSALPFPLTIDFLKSYEEKWDWTALGLNPNLSIDLFGIDDFENESFYEENIKTLIYFKNKWKYFRDFYEDERLDLYYSDFSIFTNKHINWKRDELRAAFKYEIEKYNSEVDYFHQI